MRDLRTRDFRALNESILQLNSDDNPQSFAERLLLALTSLIPCNFAAVECFENAAWKSHLLGDSDSLIETHFDAFLRLGATHPLFPSFASGRLNKESLRLSDVISRSDLRELEIYDQFLRPIGADVQMAVAVPLLHGSADVLILSRNGRDFNLREKQRLTGLLPHITLARRRSLLLSFATTDHSFPPGENMERFFFLLQQGRGLTRRESEVVWWMIMGKSDRDIAEICRLSRRTVGKHCENIYRKLGVECRTAAVSYALRHYH